MDPRSLMKRSITRLFGENLEPTLWMESDRLGFPVLRDLDLQDERKIVKMNAASDVKSTLWRNR